VSIVGDVSRISAGTVGGDAKVPALKSLTVQSLGLFGESTLAVADQASTGLDIHGAVPKLTVKDDLRTNIDLSDSDGALGSVTIGGSIVGHRHIAAPAGIGLVKVVGDIRATGGELRIAASAGPIGAITVDGNIVGESANHNVVISAYGQLTAPTKGTDLALKTFTVKGSVEFLSIVLGQDNNADASLGTLSVGGDWIASSVTAGTEAGGDDQVGTADDEKSAGAAMVRDNANIVSSIGSFTVKGQALGTAITTDMFGVVAEQIGKAKVGGRTFAFTKTGTEAFFAAPTLGARVRRIRCSISPSARSARRRPQAPSRVA